MKKFLLIVLMLLTIAVTPIATVQTAQAWPVQCADGFFNYGCLIAVIQDFILGGPWNGDWDIGGHNW